MSSTSHRPFLPLTEVVRSGRVESCHLGAAVVADAEGHVLRWAGEPGLASYLRSAAKPLQLLTMLEQGLERHTALTREELAVCAASHGGEEAHVACVRELLHRGGLHEDLLRCGAHAPLEAAAHEALLRAGEAPTPLHNNCSGKHAAMLLTAAANGWELEGYLDPDHPLQQRVAATVERFSGVQAEVGVDGCGVPTYYLSLHRAAQAYARFMAAAQGGGTAFRVVNSMTRHPWFTSGSHRLAYLLMRAAPGLLAKEGAEGFFAVGIPAERSPWGRPVALTVKVLDGAGEGARGRDPAVASALLSLGVLSPGEVAAVEALASRPLHTAAGRAVGVVRGILSMSSP